MVSGLTVGVLEVPVKRLLQDNNTALSGRQTQANTETKHREEKHKKSQKSAFLKYI